MKCFQQSNLEKTRLLKHIESSLMTTSNLPLVEFEQIYNALFKSIDDFCVQAILNQNVNEYNEEIYFLNSLSRGTKIESDNKELLDNAINEVKFYRYINMFLNPLKSFDILFWNSIENYLKSFCLFNN